MLRIYLFGSMRVHYENPYRDIRLTRTIQGLLAYLILQGTRPCPRQVLAGVFWGDNDETSARNCLNTALWRMRLALEAPPISDQPLLLSTPGGEICLNPDSPLWVDALEFEAMIKTALAQPAHRMQQSDIDVLEQCLNLYHGELLESFYDDWALRERERMRLLCLSAREHLMHCYQERNELERSLETGLLLLRDDPLREDIHRAVMRLYHASGRRAQAMLQYERCRELIRRELGIEPMPETQALAERIQAGDPLLAKPVMQRPSASTTHAAPSVQETAVAVTLEEVQSHILQAQQTVALAQQQLVAAVNLLQELNGRNSS
jgi:DNA-binding SARP family transcriptional activator